MKAQGTHTFASCAMEYYLGDTAWSLVDRQMAKDEIGNVGKEEEEEGGGAVAAAQRACPLFAAYLSGFPNLVDIPATVEEEGTVYYVVTVSTSDQRKWAVRSDFAQFIELRKSLLDEEGLEFPLCRRLELARVDFPAKSSWKRWFGGGSQQRLIASRRKALCKWLTRAVEMLQGSRVLSAFLAHSKSISAATLVELGLDPGQSRHLATTVSLFPDGAGGDAPLPTNSIASSTSTVDAALENAAQENVVAGAEQAEGSVRLVATQPAQLDSQVSHTRQDASVHKTATISSSCTTVAIGASLPTLSFSLAQRLDSSAVACCAVVSGGAGAAAPRPRCQTAVHVDVWAALAQIHRIQGGGVRCVRLHR